MKPRITDKRKILLAGKDFFGDPYEKAGGWSEGNAIGQLWKRFESFYQKKKGSLKHAVSESGYEVWIDFEEEKDTKNKYIFTGVEVEKIEDLPLELVARTLPEVEPIPLHRILLPLFSKNSLTHCTGGLRSRSPPAPDLPDDDELLGGGVAGGLQTVEVHPAG